MRVSDFLTHLSVTAPFSSGRIDQIAKALRHVHLFPLGHRKVDRHVTIPEAATFLWCLFTGTTPSNLQFALMYLLGMEGPQGQQFLQDLVRILSDPKVLRSLHSIEVTNNFGAGTFAEITFLDASKITYGHPGELRSSAIITGDYLRKFCLNLYRKQYNPFEGEHGQTLDEAFEQANPKIFHEMNAIVKSLNQ